ncbi:hypothetical protein [Terrisporobacter sp.]
MDIIKNINNKTVCYVDKEKKSVEIVKKGLKTIIQFNSDDTYDVIHSKLDKK